MNDNRAIGVFDSGIGGLTVLEAIHRELPAESTVYLGDVARCPYGPRPRDEVRRFAVEITRFLTAQHQLKMLVIACNTASAAAFRDVQQVAPSLSVEGVIEPGARAAVAISRNKRIGVIATAGTVQSHAYRAAVAAADAGATVVEEACPQLVPLVEAGRTDSEEAVYWIHRYMEPLWEARVDTLILGCTHYPLLRPVIDRVTAGQVAIVDSAHTTAIRVRQVLQEGDLLRTDPAQADHLLYTTGEAAEFRGLAHRLFHLSVHEVRQAVLQGSQQGVAVGKPPPRPTALARPPAAGRGGAGN